MPGRSSFFLYPGRHSSFKLNDSAERAEPEVGYSDRPAAQDRLSDDQEASYSGRPAAKIGVRKTNGISR
ncbi:hypothetical protein M153_5130004652 [Pseudoloma neurophilia]|uniref:Uncharacterized protein n=1 Tax=Pseudoloma neurophilia TaxID=146866 RepID=A0A0R0LX08_9MICR|nr:hypothetical protein M153_5130004652 [Pseudoloma neurophilia]